MNPPENKTDSGYSDQSESDEEYGTLDANKGSLLGFLEPVDHPVDMSRFFFPCKAGGRPAWLNPLNLPSSSELTCKTCGDPLQFLLQLKAAVRNYSRSFHRCLFLFACQKGSCISRSPESSVRIFRSQLPRENPYYPPVALSRSTVSGVADISYTKSSAGNLVLDDKYRVPLCIICGVFASKICSSCHSTNYCSRDHQLLDWKAGHKSICKSLSDKLQSGESSQDPTKQAEISETSPNVCKLVSPDNDSEAELLLRVKRRNLLLKEMEIVIEEGEESDGEDEGDKENPIKPRELELLQEYESQQKAGISEESEDAEFSSRDWKKNFYRGNHDVKFQMFQAVIAQDPDQIIRYNKDAFIAPLPPSQKSGESHKSCWRNVLWMNEHALPPPPPKCQYCNGPRVFEFQLMAQFLYLIGIDPKTTDAPDWDLMVVSSCLNSCGDGIAGYFEEHVLVQSSMDPEGKTKVVPPADISKLQIHAQTDE